MITRLILGPIGMALGFLVVWKAEWIYENFGANGWAENHLGTEGGSRLLYKLLGILLILASLMYLTGLIQGFLMAILGGLFMVK